ncbi:hypothetical protein HELRODRAFT_176231 [Helobdella robusta]|uniref:WH1 domain-containing protein n=1 Tax=Helobdella robusta TaxID=6412 RepID=T1FAB5_HELRO|nr:hypothetical protein HELRODRAFT_176231 [Helobdella robusta]ESN99936.1 hypothetical protein HELRODRAFT_176231 [Helobdella robusta]
MHMHFLGISGYRLLSYQSKITGKPHRKIVQVRAQVMRWDNSTGLWGQCGGGGLSRVYLFRVLGLLLLGKDPEQESKDQERVDTDQEKENKDSENDHQMNVDGAKVDVGLGLESGTTSADDPDLAPKKDVYANCEEGSSLSKDDSYSIQAYRIVDSAMLLNCNLTKDLDYQCANNSMLHHWVVDGQKFGLTFQSSSEAILFKEAVLRALAHLKLHDDLLRKGVEDVRHLMKPSFTEGHISSINKNFEKTQSGLSKDFSSSQDKNFDILRKRPYQQQLLQHKQPQHRQQQLLSNQRLSQHVSQVLKLQPQQIVPPPRLQTTVLSHPIKPRAITPPSSPTNFNVSSSSSSSPPIAPSRVPHGRRQPCNNPPVPPSSYQVAADVHRDVLVQGGATLSSYRHPAHLPYHLETLASISAIQVPSLLPSSSATSTAASIATSTIPFSSPLVAVTSKTSTIANEYIPSPQQRHQQVEQKLSNFCYTSNDQQQISTTPNPNFMTTDESVMIESTFRRGSTLSAGESYVHFTKNNPCTATTKHDYSYPSLFSVQHNQPGWGRAHSNPRISSTTKPPLASRSMGNTSSSLSSSPQRHSSPHVLLPKRSKSKGKPRSTTVFRSKFTRATSSSMMLTFDTSNVPPHTPSAKTKCYYCQEYFSSKDFSGTICRDAPNKYINCIKKVTCFCCAETAIYHCARPNDGDDGNEQGGGSDERCKKNLIYALVCLFVPCLWCYPVLKSSHNCAVGCGFCRPKHKPTV